MSRMDTANSRVFASLVTLPLRLTTGAWHRTWPERTGGGGLHLAAAGEGPAERDLVGVLEVAADGQAAREAGHANAASQPVREERGGRLAGHVRVGCEHDLLHAVRLHAPHQLVDPQVAGLDSVERRERAAEHVVEPAKLVGALERDHVDGLLDDAHERVVAPRVRADRAQLLFGEVP